MSHIVEVQTEVRDPAAIRAACRRLSLPEPVHGETRLFSGTAAGWQVRLPGWRYPLVCDTEAARLRYDNYGGRWGDPAQLDRFVQGYTVEKAKLEARRHGYTATEQSLEDGSIRVSVQVGGAP